jgi:hypothetical protein
MGLVGLDASFRFEKHSEPSPDHARKDRCENRTPRYFGFAFERRDWSYRVSEGRARPRVADTIARRAKLLVPTSRGMDKENSRVLRAHILIKLE